MKLKIIFLCLFFLWGNMNPFYIFPEVPEVFLIVNRETRLSSTSFKKKDIKDIYTGKITRWGDGSKIVLTIRDRTKLNRQFLRDCVKKTPSQFRNFWRRKVFTGEGQSPKSFKTEKDLIAFIAKTKGAIGYISNRSSIADLTVKIIPLSGNRGGKK